MEKRAPKKQSQNRQKTLKKILDAAERTFAQHGYTGASFSMIARAADIPKSNILYYFPNKESLYRTVVEDIFSVWVHAADSIEEDTCPRAALASYIDLKMELARSRPFGSKVWANEVIQGAPVLQDYLVTELRDWTETRIKVINTWIEKGKMRPVNARNLLYMIWATTQHYADFSHQIEKLNNNKPMSSAQWEEAKVAVKAIILDGVLTADPAPPPSNDT